jgi:gluconate kinase
VSDSDGFRKQAEDARQMAGRALKKEDKAFWLRLAEDWAKLAQDADEKPKRR